MTLEKIIDLNNFGKYDYDIRPKSQVNFDSCIKMNKYIDVRQFWYDDKTDPNVNTWIDIEGIGYGWIWTANKIRGNFKFLQRKAIRKFAKNILNDIPDDENIIIYKNDNIYILGFMESPDCYTQIRISDQMLDW